MMLYFSDIKHKNMTNKRALSLIFFIAIFMFLLNYVKPSYAVYHFGCGFPTCICSEYDDDGNSCYYSYGGCFGVFCLEGCFYYGQDTNKPSCDPYTSGSTCYYGGTAQCTSSGWSCSYSSSCSLCSGKLIGSCTSSGCTNFYKCASSCGASAVCNDKCRSTIVSSSVYCDSSCNSVTCDSSRNCAQVDDNEVNWCMGGGSVGGYKYCTYDGSSWAWRSSYPAEVCNDGVDNDCDGAIDCSDSNCPAPSCSNYVIPVCDSVSHQWRCDPCTTTSQCISNYCCEFEKGGSQTCRYLGWVYGNAYLCG